MNTAYSITSKGQVTIPKEIRKKMQITQHSRISFREENGRVFIQKMPTLEDVAKEMHEQFVRSGRKPATDKEIKQAREKFYREGGKW